jgi:hypothetical protein
MQQGRGYPWEVRKHDERLWLESDGAGLRIPNDGGPKSRN